MRLLIGKMGIDRRWFLGFLGLLVSVLMTGVPGHAQASAKMRWDIITIDFTAMTANAGGKATAKANDGSWITLTGTGTFRKLPLTTRFSAIAKEGGGTWEIFDSTGTSTAKGTYTVKRGPSSFAGAVGTFPATLTDLIGNAADVRAGLLVVEIKYDDGDRGLLTVSCSLVGSPANVFEGITVTKGSVDYWARVRPVAGVDGNRTNYHVIP